MSRRDGSTLMEVLIAIFVMGIGLLSVLAMFPMGALTMARAIKDDSAGHASANARAIAAAQNIRFDPSVAPYFDLPPGAAYDVPPLDGPSYAVYVDPFGFSSYTAGADQSFVGRDTGIRRSTLSFVAPGNVSNVQQVLRWCTRLDDIAFGPNAQPSTETGSASRTTSVSWAWLLRRPRAGTPSYCEMTVVIYNQRPLTNTVQLAAKEQSYPGCLVGGASNQQMNVVTLSWTAGQVSPRLVEGGWILDATPNALPGGKAGPCNAGFYRIVNVGDYIGNTVEIELDKPLRGFPRPGNIATMVILDGVVEVQECGGSWNAFNN
jgi:hypothetical protein